MSERKYHYHTVTIDDGEFKFIASQRYVKDDPLLKDGEAYYLRHYHYAVMKGEHLVATGNIQGSNMDKIDKEEAQKSFDRVMESYDKGRI